MEHPLDQASRLEYCGEGRYHGRFTPAYANFIGPFGGAISATLLRGVLEHPERQGSPLALTVNFAAPVADAPYELVVRPTRSNRSTQHWQVELLQDAQILVTASVILVIRREGYRDQERQMPQVPSAERTPVTDTHFFPAWARNYRMQFVQGLPVPQASAQPPSSESRLWVRDEPARPLDYLGLTALADVFFPRVFLRAGKLGPAGTVTLTIYFHADEQALAGQGDRPLLGCARANRFHDGYFDQRAELWSDDGALLVSTEQLVYFKL